MKILKTVLRTLCNLFDFSDVYLAQENVSELRTELVKLIIREHWDSGISTKCSLVADFLYKSILDSSRKYPKDIERIGRKYAKIVPYVFGLGGRAELYSENFDAKRTAKIIVEILLLKKDELDKVDGGLPVI
ncbi:hypothetical protein [Catenibacterium sp.]|uniref:hypothetical protein n=1 Tax=Catenibacterium sp. TaxID=2049022 RepID=UPI002E7764CD|nr:hypothetical protein [Catenibacterium sp.]MEE0042478.1 hypothetical protein [Catenibacterium sp.]